MNGSHARKLIILALLARCKCGSGGAADASSWIDAEADVFVARSPELEDLWMRAADESDEVELERLADREGERGLEERAAMPRYRVTALRA